MVSSTYKIHKDVRYMLWKKIKSSYRVIVVSLILFGVFFVSILFIQNYLQGGSVMVYEELEDFNARSDWSFGELGEYFVKIAHNKGGAYAFEVLKSVKLPPNIDLHLLAHIVGDELYNQQGLGGMKVCTHDFRNACSHTIVIGALLESGVGVFDKINDVCKEAPGGSGAYTMCFHGFGHGVLAFAEYEVSEAIELCSQTGTEAYRDREYIECVGGMTMEMMSGVHNRELWTKKVDKYFDKDDPMAFCGSDIFPKETRSICYIYLTPKLFEAAGTNLGNPDPETFRDAFRFCDQLSAHDVQNREACYGGFGKEFVVLVKDRDIRSVDTISDKQLETVYNWCLLADDKSGIKYCVSHALASLYWGGENKPDPSIRFCGVIKEPGLQDGCITELIQNVSTYIRNDTSYYENFCSSLPNVYRKKCRSSLL